MTLYTFDRDTMGAGKSACNGPCATNWPPLDGHRQRQGHAATGTVVMRDDGSPGSGPSEASRVYYWAKDAKPGDSTGDGFKNVWRLARP